jgi:hypothetical protein
MTLIAPSRGEPTKPTPAEGSASHPLYSESVGSEQGMPRGADVRGVFQGGLFILALLAALYAGREIVLPIVLAIILNLLMQPALRLLERLHIPRMLGAFLLIALLFGTIVAFVTGMSGPASSWAAKLPEGVPRLQEHQLSARPNRSSPAILAAGTGLCERQFATGRQHVPGPGFWRGPLASYIFQHERLRRWLLGDGSRTFLPAAFGRHVPTPSCRGPAELQRQAAGSRNLAAHRA